MKTLLLALALLGSVSMGFAQTSAAPIVVQQKFGTVFSSNGQTLAPKQLLDLTQSNPAAYQEMKAAKGNYDVAMILSFAGGALVGWPIGTAIGGGEANWTLAGVGAGLIGLSIPFSSAYSKRAKEAARLYNSGLSQTSLQPIDFRLGLTGNGLGLNIRF